MAETSEMVERVAKALLFGDHIGPGTLCPWEEQSREAKAHARKKALIAIRAMREPTAAMIEAGRWPAEDDGPIACWQAMVDAALPSPAEPG